MSSVDRATKRRRVVELTIALLEGPQAFFSFYALSWPFWGRLLSFLGFMAVAVLVAALILRWIEALERPSPSARFGEYIVIVAKGAVRWTVYGLPGIIAVTAVFFFVTSVWPYTTNRVWPALTHHQVCGAPMDLRVVAGPENAAALLTDAADRYVAEKSRNGCRTVTVTVTAASSLDQLESGLAGGWVGPDSSLDRLDCAKLPSRLALLGPQPDIWIPESGETVDWVRDRLGHGDSCSLAQNPLRVEIGSVHATGSIGSSPLVLGVFADADRPEVGGDAGQPSLAALLQAFTNYRLLDLKSVVRPSPDTSESALLSTPFLYRALRTADQTDEDVERLLDHEPMAGGDATSLLCRFRADDAAGKGPPSNAAVVLPESVLARYDHGDALRQDVSCPWRVPSAKWQLYPFYTSDLPMLDYPFVHLRWPGQDTGRRNEAVEDFYHWLAKGQSTREGLRTTAGRYPADSPYRKSLQSRRNDVPETVSRPTLHDSSCAGSLSRTLDCYDSARPKYPLSLMIDISGSMANTVAGGPRLARAQGVAERVMADVRSGSPISLYLFSSVTHPANGPTGDTGDGATFDNVLGAVRRATTNGRDLDLVTAVGQAVPSLKQGRQTLLLLTDGQIPNTNPDTARRARELAKQLKDRLPALRVLTVLTGPSGCGDPPVRDFVGAFGKDSCLAQGQLTTDDFASLVASDIAGGWERP
ncbi:vWA domain-containing protein [Actinoallomurus rhizosphaericola]|uniref:VWA domain-containing protein n=1 Tax=Actinoallomurus rhizosphaericola TaxID=2952536 RepID=UPI0020908B2C|nr:VWA domain-containing protein [Actinoallomurus rhizosphaericola]MCO5992749.1 substrate-binding domain-containing protein [Actinoallomurus rhizosphaericola]